MTKRGSKKTDKGLNDKPRAETVVVKGTITKKQREVLQNFIGIIGSNEQDVIGKILTLWMYNEGHLKELK